MEMSLSRKVLSISSIFEQLVIAELIHSGNFERHINRVRRKRRKSNAIDFIVMNYYS